jgi:hypothetical protein
MEDEIAFFKRITQALQIKKESSGDANGMNATQAGAAIENASSGSEDSGIKALVHYAYERGEDNEIDLTKGEYVTHFEMVDADWWLGTSSKGEISLFPSNYVVLVEKEEAPASAASFTETDTNHMQQFLPHNQEHITPLMEYFTEPRDQSPNLQHTVSIAFRQNEEAEPTPLVTGSSSLTALAIFRYEAAEDNEIGFEEGATITDIVSCCCNLPPMPS